MFMNMSWTLPILGEALLHVTVRRPIYMYTLYLYLLSNLKAIK